jgi:membrane protease subunit (stomatin/prohibitin family)
MPLRRRPLLRAAAVGGSAYVMGKRSAQRAATSQDQDAQISQQETQQTSPDAAQGSMLDELGRLTSMHDKGVLTDAEFSQAKAKLLNS